MRKPRRWIERLPIRRGLEAEQHQDRINKCGYEAYLRDGLFDNDRYYSGAEAYERIRHEIMLNSARRSAHRVALPGDRDEQAPAP